LKAKENREKKVILFNLSGNGYFDIMAYKEYLNGTLKDYEYPGEEVKKSLSSPDMPKIDESKF